MCACTSPSVIGRAGVCAKESARRFSIDACTVVAREGGVTRGERHVSGRFGRMKSIMPDRVAPSVPRVTARDFAAFGV